MQRGLLFHKKRYLRDLRRAGTDSAQQPLADPLLSLLSPISVDDDLQETLAAVKSRRERRGPSSWQLSYLHAAPS